MLNTNCDLPVQIYSIQPDHTVYVLPFPRWFFPDVSSMLRTTSPYYYYYYCLPSFSTYPSLITPPLHTLVAPLQMDIGAPRQMLHVHAGMPQASLYAKNI